MKPEPLLKSEAPSAELLGLHVAARTEMLKAKVSSYTRKDGVFVAEHHDNRTAAVPKQPAGKARAAAAKESPSVQPDSPQTAHSAASLGVLADHHDAEDQAHDKAASKKGESHPDYDTHVALSALHSSASRLAGKAREASSGDERAIYMGKHAEVKKKIGTHEAKLSGGGMAKSFCWLGGGGAAGDDVPVPMGFRRPAVG